MNGPLTESTVPRFFNKATTYKNVLGFLLLSIHRREQLKLISSVKALITQLLEYLSSTSSLTNHINKRYLIYIIDLL